MQSAALRSITADPAAYNGRIALVFLHKGQICQKIRTKFL